MARLTQTRAERAPIPTDKPIHFERCSEVKGFCAGITKDGTRTWYVEFPSGGRKKLDRVNVLPCESTPDQKGARDLAIAALHARRFGKDVDEAIDRKKKPKGLTANEVWQSYLDAGSPKLRGTGRKRESTIAADKLRWAKYVEKSIGKKPVAGIDEAAVQRWLDKEFSTKGQRDHTLTLLKSILSYAASRKLAETKPIAIKPGKSKEMQNFYGVDELVALDKAAAALAAESPHRRGVFSAIRLVLHTGARAGEIYSARWQDIDARRAVLMLEKDKTSDNGREIHLTDEAIAIIAALPQINQWLFPSPEAACGHLTTTQKAWAEAIEKAGVRRFRLHDLRHSFASTLIGNGVSLYTTGKLLGHRQATTTARYAHLEHSAARDALDKMSGALRMKRGRAA